MDSNSSDTQCYNISFVKANCEFYNNCTSVYFVSQLTTDSEYVTLVNDRVDVVFEERLHVGTCGKSQTNSFIDVISLVHSPLFSR